MVIRSISVCSGIGGLDLGLKLANPTIRTVCYIERETFAAATLVARMEEQALDQAPIWDDIATFDGHPWRNRVDLITGGIPCQAFNSSGLKRGTDDPRWLWPEFWRIVNETNASAIFIENVQGFHSKALPVIAKDLAGSGWNAEWGHLRAESVGAPHRRKRFFFFAWKDTLANADCYRWNGGTGAKEESIHGVGFENDNKVLGFPPGIEELEKWRTLLESDPQAQPSLCGNANGISDGVDYNAFNRNRRNRIRVLGNAVVPLVAAHAFTILTQRAFHSRFIGK